jgi:hypothetical protein
MDRLQAINGIAVFSMLALIGAAGLSELMSKQEASSAEREAKTVALRDVIPTGGVPAGFEATAAVAATAGPTQPVPTVPPTLDLALTATMAPATAITIGDPRTNLRDAPNTDSLILAELEPGTALPVLGQWAGSNWLLVQWPDSPTHSAWVYLPLVTIQGDLSLVPSVTP